METKTPKFTAPPINAKQMGTDTFIRRHQPPVPFAHTADKGCLSPICTTELPLYPVPHSAHIAAANNPTAPPIHAKQMGTDTFIRRTTPPIPFTHTADKGCLSLICTTELPLSPTPHSAHIAAEKYLRLHPNTGTNHDTL